MNFKKTTQLITLTILATLLISTTIHTQTTKAETTFLYFDPDPSTEEVGNTFTLSFEIKDSPRIYAWYANITWDTTILNITRISEGSFLNQGGVRRTNFAKNINYTAGWAYFGCGLLGEPASAQPSGSGVLAEIKFIVLSRGETYIHFASSSLYDYWTDPTNPVSKPHTAKDGYFKSPFYTVYIQPSLVHNGSLVADTTFNVSLSAFVENLFSWKAEISWNNTILEMINAYEGPFLAQGQYTTQFNYSINQTQSIARLNGTLIEPAEPANSTSTDLGILAYIEFRVKALGESNITLADVDLFNPDGVAIGRRLVSGLFKNIWHDASVQSITISATNDKVTIGQIVNVTVVVKNIGNMPDTLKTTLYAGVINLGYKMSTLEPSETESLFFTWNTTGLTAGNYEIKASIEPLLGEVNVGNNEKVYGTITVEAPSGFAVPFEIIVAVVIIIVIAVLGLFLMRKRKS